MAQNLSELCTLLVDDLYGGLSSKVFSTLARRGRLSLQALARFTDLPTRHLKHSLVILIQQHLVLHYSSEEEDITYYEANLAQAYALVRFGKIIKLVEDRYGESGAGIISNLLALGHARVDDLADAYGVYGKKRARPNAPDHQPNGGVVSNGANADTSNMHIQSLNQLHQQLNELLESGFIATVQEKHFMPQADIQNEADRMAAQRISGSAVRGTKKQAELNSAIRDIKRKWRGDEDDAAGRAVKRKRINGLFSHADGSVNSLSLGSEGSFIDGNLTVRVNYDKCNVALRNQDLVKLAATYVGECTSKVYEAFLKALEEKIPRCQDELIKFQSNEEELDSQPFVTSFDVMSNLNPDLNLTNGLCLEDGQHYSQNGIDTVNGGIGVEAAGPVTEQNPEVSKAVLYSQRRAQIEQHMNILQKDPRQFAIWAGSKGGGEWKADFRSLSSYLIQHELEATITARFGSIATRIIRILHDKGKLDEKQAANIAMLRQKDIRSTLTAMQEAGVVETQEVPKDTTRQPSRTMYLWFFDQDRCRRLFLIDTYKAMARHFQRIKVERSRVQSVIDKAERTDVIGNEDEYLSTTERHALREWSQTEEKLLTQIGRQDDLVAVLRDYIPPPTG